ncbi:alpha-L-arabinofuranosidase C-terminal domain-containing protein [Prevotella sp. E2-28]|uniref:alpha-L-arabinofuranosidase C-terminal domain-containing protein n=1 Tax=Prevotella sp. E2-28 TaxID=2913620 RepID=UPI001ED9F7F9|nr:alpha-L-arabinofuranosidase C-terminal domain-containing protein [Prevotella sp. E2-28]UKK53601.1 carbohydrate binding domain-containing protein [Prevotella sp. E2-28]
MKLRIFLLLATSIFANICGIAQNKVFIYSPNPGAGLHIASEEGGKWKDLGQLCSSDYGTWGVEKKMYRPSLCRATDGSWRLVFQVNDRAPLFAASYSKDLITWRPQDYPFVSAKKCLSPVVTPAGNFFSVCYKTGDNSIRCITGSNDFRHFYGDVAVSSVNEKMWQRDSIDINGQRIDGQYFSLTDKELNAIRSHFAERAQDGRLSNERMHDDAQNLKLPAIMEATLTVFPNEEKPISDKLIGIFFEDISYAADGGLYAELIQNRDFEYTARDHRGWNATTAWHSSRPIEIATEHPLHPNNPHYALIWPDTLWNEGWDGIVVEKGKKYDFSMYVLAGGQKQDFLIQLTTDDGTVLAQSKLKTRATDWQQYATVLTAKASAEKARLIIIPLKAAHVGIDMVSLFPKETFMNRKNGLRKDLAQVIADLHPKFVRFPGGCMSHGQGLENIYHWNHTVGPLQERKPDFNIWNYHQTRGLGFFEYFQFCEDIGAEPLPVLAAGVPCQNSANNAEGIGGQQGGIPMSDMPAYIEEICNLIEWANGDPATNEWAKMRADAGHPAPFNLKYLGLGNEDIISTVYEERYEMLCKAIRERYPDIKICGTVGPFHTPSADYLEGWDFTKKHPDLQFMVDEHYYESTGWFMNHRDYYDSYDRSAAKVYLGEWAASTRAKRPNVETALAEALYLTDIERNGDVVEMTSYAPMLSKDGHSNWNPDMIYFSNTNIRTTPAYEIQRIFSVYGGDRYISSKFIVHSSKLNEGEANSEIAHRIGASVVRDSKTGKQYLKLVNALPSTLKIRVDGIQTPTSVKCLQFTGAIDDQKAKAVEIETNEPTSLPPYSLRVIEL